MAATERKLSFTSVNDEKAILLAAGGQTFFALLLEWEFISLESGIAPFVPAIFAVLIVRALLGSLQRVQIRGTTVRVLDVTTWYLWRSVDVADVRRIEYWTRSSVEGGAYLKVSLKPCRNRRRRAIRLVRTGRNDDGFVFDAFMSLVHEARPDLEVHRLPQY